MTNIMNNHGLLISDIHVQQKLEAKFCNIRLLTGVMLSFWGVWSIVIKLNLGNLISGTITKGKRNMQWCPRKMIYNKIYKIKHPRLVKHLLPLNSSRRVFKADSG